MSENLKNDTNTYAVDKVEYSPIVTGDDCTHSYNLNPKQYGDGFSQVLTTRSLTFNRSKVTLKLLMRGVADHPYLHDKTGGYDLNFTLVAHPGDFCKVYEKTKSLVYYTGSEVRTTCEYLIDVLDLNKEFTFQYQWTIPTSYDSGHQSFYFDSSVLIVFSTLYYSLGEEQESESVLIRHDSETSLALGEEQEPELEDSDSSLEEVREEDAEEEISLVKSSEELHLSWSGNIG